MKVVIDLEATCAQREGPGSEGFNQDLSEIIEIGACLLDDQCQIVATFQTFVKPILQPILTPFCIEFLGILQADVEQAPPFEKAQADLDSWFDECTQEFGKISLWGSWGGYDSRQFKRNNAHLGTEPGRFLSLDYLNLKVEYAKVHAGIITKKRMPGVGMALKQQRMTFDGRQHRALDDAKNIARLCKVIFGVEPSKLRSQHK